MESLYSSALTYVLGTKSTIGQCLSKGFSMVETNAEHEYVVKSLLSVQSFFTEDSIFSAKPVTGQNQ